MRQQIKSWFLLLVMPAAFANVSLTTNSTTYISSDSASYNYKTGIEIFSGHAKIVQATFQLMGDTIMIYNLPNTQTINKVVAIGQLAQYDTLPVTQQPRTHAQAQRIEYYPAQKKVLLLGQGKVTQGENKFSGEHIEYQMDKQVVLSSPSKTTKTIIIIPPQQN